VNEIPPDIQRLAKYFTLRNPRWIEKHGKGVRRKSEEIEMGPPKPKNSFSVGRFDDDAGYIFSGTPTLSATSLISASEPMKGAIERAKWHLP
jgi:hypothetical protein